MNSIYLIPNYLTSDAEPNDISPSVKIILPKIRHFLVENVRTARRFISSMDLGIDISQLHFEVMDKNTSRSAIASIMQNWQNHPVGVISEAGLPGLADPGNQAVSLAHEQGRKIIPLPGASSIQTALICSGFDGQKFTFHGYAPIDEQECTRFLKDIESMLNKSGYTQLFMETPYRNKRLIKMALHALHPETYFLIAADLFGQNEYIKSLKIKDWKAEKLALHKLPAVFGIGHFPNWSS